MLLLEISELHSQPLLGGFALQQISWQQQVQEKVALIGETGSGKSTLLKIIAGFTQAASGTILFEGKKVLGPNYQLIAGEEGMAYLSQHYELRHNYKMSDLLALRNDMTEEESAELFALCKIDHLLARNSKQLSGGEQQRIALACLLVRKPRLLILDEPFSNLDAIHKAELKAVINSVAERYGTSLILASHDANDVLPWADKIVVLQKGEIVQVGTSKDVFDNPANDYTAALLGAYNKLSCSLAKALGIETDNAFVYTRPHVFQITSGSGLEAIVKACQYFGTHYQLTLECQAETLVLLHDNELQVGAKVTLT
ncbi:MAG: hypothetical protein RL660_1761 [Bacteroidota bacterium]|jgi:iron(III) transport system ATP-binding protein